MRDPGPDGERQELVSRRALLDGALRAVTDGPDDAGAAVVLDLFDAGYLGCCAVRPLAAFRRRLEADRRRLVVTGVRGIVRHLLLSSELSELITGRVPGPARDLSAPTGRSVCGARDGRGEHAQAHGRFRELDDEDRWRCRATSVGPPRGPDGQQLRTDAAPNAPVGVANTTTAYTASTTVVGLHVRRRVWMSSTVPS